MARPCKTGLHYFPFDVDFFDDFKIMDLLNEYGTLGVLIYENILCKVYNNGYYLEIPLEKLAASIVRDIGNRWAKDKKLVLQVIQYCADIGLFNHDLLTQSVITSAGIQRRYQTVTVRNKLIKSKYWLLEKENDQEVLINAPSKNVNVAETPINVAETPINVAETIPKENININQKKINYIPPALSLPLSNGETLAITETEINNLINRYKGINVRVEFVNLKNWLEQNPEKRRSAGQTRRLIEKWMYNKRKKVTESNGIDKRNPEQAGDTPGAEIDENGIRRDEYGGVIL
ncbi:MAG: DUF4373 domain-containing protein [Ruminococcus sp.]|nr:DUF4373 domain-containing protein [Ruminococcus sp.]